MKNLQVGHADNDCVFCYLKTYVMFVDLIRVCYKEMWDVKWGSIFGWLIVVCDYGV